MTLKQFIASLSFPNPPKDASVPLQALWQDAKGNWHAAHELVGALEESNAYWVHAYLHRKEGDASNAHYWYERAGKKMPEHSLPREWEEIVAVLL
jgi:hypothetical protein